MPIWPPIISRTLVIIDFRHLRPLVPATQNPNNPILAVWGWAMRCGVSVQTARKIKCFPQIPQTGAEEEKTPCKCNSRLTPPRKELATAPFPCLFLILFVTFCLSTDSSWQNFPKGLVRVVTSLITGLSPATLLPYYRDKSLIVPLLYLYPTFTLSSCYELEKQARRYL